VRVLLAFVLVVAACKGKPTPTSDPGTASGAAKGTSEQGSVIPQKGSNVAPDIVLPKGPGAPPKKVAKVDADKLKAMSLLQFAGFNRNAKKVTDSALEVTQRTDSRPRILATVFVSRCDDKCTPMDLAKWKAKDDILKIYILPDLRKEVDFDVGETTLNGEKMIYTYQLGFQLGTNEENAQKGLFTNAYVLYYNDDVNQITVVAEYKDQLPASKQALTELAPREDLEKVAKAFVDVYTQSW